MVFLVVSIVAQVWVTGGRFALPWIAKVGEVWGEPVWKRTGYLSQWLGPERTEYIGFLREEIPEEATVYVPSEGYSGGIFRFDTLLQYYLYPRRVDRCPPQDLEVCLREAASKASGRFYILQVGDFPSIGAEELGMSLIPYNEEWALYGPSEG